jgi:LacI family transcriptional regulator
MISAGYGEDEVAESRYRAYKQALEDHGIIYQGDYMSGGDYSMASGYHAMKILLDKDITAVFAIADAMALGAIKAIHDCGLNVPNDISVLGFDGLEVGKYYVPTLTTVEQPTKYLGIQTGHMMIDVLKDNMKNRHIVLETKLNHGHSTRKI